MSSGSFLIVVDHAFVESFNGRFRDECLNQYWFTSLGDANEIIARWKNYVLNNLGSDYFYNSLDIVRNVSAEELQELAKKYLNPDDFYELMVV